MDNKAGQKKQVGLKCLVAHCLIVAICGVLDLTASKEMYLTLRTMPLACVVWNLNNVWNIN